MKSAARAACVDGMVSFELVTGFSFQGSKNSTHPDHDAIKTMPDVLNLQDCLSQCLRMKECRSVNFETGLCVLLNSQASDYHQKQQHNYDHEEDDDDRNEFKFTQSSPLPVNNGASSSASSSPSPSPSPAMFSASSLLMESEAIAGSSASSSSTFYSSFRLPSSASASATDNLPISMSLREGLKVSQYPVFTIYAEKICMEGK